MTNKLVCHLCGQACDDGRPFTVTLDGAAAHVVCLEDEGLWNAKPEELR